MALTTAEKLAAARDAYHRLMTGEQAVEVRDSDGSSVRYTQANASRLRTYIKELEAQLAGSTRPVGPLRPVFG